MSGTLFKIRGIALFLAQVFLTLKGAAYFGKFISPLLLFLAFIDLFFLYLSYLVHYGVPPESKVTRRHAVVGFFMGAAAVALCIPACRQLFRSVPHPVDFSDVLPQLEFQYDSFLQGKMPYRPMVLPHSRPFPVYMPMHWLPVSLSRLAHVDVRWCGLAVLAIVNGVYGAKVWSTRSGLFLRMLAISLPPFVLYGFVQWGEREIAVSLETVVAGYYLLLGAALWHRRLVPVALAIGCCMLSRYTLIFWLPLFFLTLWWAKGLLKTAQAAVIVLVMLLVGYILPFLLRDPSIFLTGLAYHNSAAEYEWEYGAWSFETGVYFAPHIHALLRGSFTYQVFVARALQATAMLLIFFAGAAGYRRWRREMDVFDFGLAALYLTIFCFYMIGPLTYRYYMITPLVLASVLCARMLCGGKPEKTGSFAGQKNK